MKLLFIGETWQGSSASSMRGALQLLPDVVIDEVGEDHYLPKHRSLVLRACNRLLRPLQMADLAREIRGRVERFRPDVVVVYKGAGVSPKLLRDLAAEGYPMVNIFPDVSPHGHGDRLKEAMGFYDLVISTKPGHPGSWRTLFGYTNKCVCVPHGYDPQVHCWADPPASQDLDVVMAATWRQEYQQLLLDFAASLNDGSVRVGVAGNGWQAHRHEFPTNWSFEGAISGRPYGAWLRRGKVAIAPVHTTMLIAGQQQPGDEDTTRSYELAAAGCFFLHLRTPYIQTVYDELTEVPMWNDAIELAGLVKRYLPLDAERRAMAARAHQRAVPAYSIPARAQQIVVHFQSLLAAKRGARA